MTEGIEAYISTSKTALPASGRLPNSGGRPHTYPDAGDYFFDDIAAIASFTQVTLSESAFAAIAIVSGGAGNGRDSHPLRKLSEWAIACSMCVRFPPPELQPVLPRRARAMVINAGSGARALRGTGW